MHYYFITLIFILAAQLGFAQPAAEESPKLRVYVWEFATQYMDKEAKILANLITNDFETEVSQSGLYELIEIRELADLREHRDLQKLIYDIDELTEEEGGHLKNKRAEAVFFGKLIYQETTQQYTLEAKLQHLDGEILKKGNVHPDYLELIGPETRQLQVHELFVQVHKDFYEAQRRNLQQARRKQYKIISEKINLFQVRLEDLGTQFRRLDLSLLSPEYVQEYQEAIEGYDEMIDDLLEKRITYEMDFNDVWDVESAMQLSEIFKKLDGFHSSYIHKWLNKRNEEIERVYQERNKQKRKKLEEEIEREKKEFEELMNDQWPVIKSEVEEFLYILRTRLQ